MAHRQGPRAAAGALNVAWPSVIANARSLGPELSRKVAVVADLVEEGEHRGIEGAFCRGMLVELAHCDEQVVDPPWATKATLARTVAGDRRRLEHYHEHRERFGAAQQVAPGPFAPAQVASQITRVAPSGSLGPIGSEA